MSCTGPVLVKSKPTPDHPHGEMVRVPCGRCPECLNAKRTAWAYRIQKEMLSHQAPTFFFTITYDDDHIPLKNGIPTVSKPSVQKFLKRLRKSLWTDFQVRLRYFIAAEYGPTTDRPHYHGFLFGLNLEQEVVDRYVCDAWPLSSVIDVQYCDLQTSVYAVKDLIAVSDYPDGADPTFYLRSTRPGLGALWTPPVRTLDKYDPRRLTERQPGGANVLIPRYLIERWYSVYDLKQIRARARQDRGDEPDLYERSLQYQIVEEAHDAAAFIRMRDRILRRFKDKRSKSSKI